MIHYERCPFCSEVDVALQFPVKDYTVSGEKFPIYKCGHCTGMFTQDVPAETAIGPYYASANYISHSNTEEGLINKLYLKVRGVTLTAKRKMVQQITGLQTGKLLDVGCGTGAFLNEMKDKGWKITGLEPDEIARANAAKLFDIHPQPSPDLFILPAKNYDAITMWHVLEHVHQLHEYLEQLKILLSERGRLFIAVPNYTAHDAMHYGPYWAAYDTPRHLYHFSPASMRSILQQHALEIVSIKPMWFDAFYVSMLSEQYKNGKGNIVKAFCIGLLSNLKALFNKERCSSVIYVIRKKAS